jgi:flavin reductase (DIM6/NTAB) family NADH-FMN oxidoreductase RutF
MVLTFVVLLTTQKAFKTIEFWRRAAMDQAVKKTALRMIPYGLYVLTAESKDGQIAAATVNWVTQASFEPPLVVVGVKTGSSAFSVIKDSRVFALNVLGKGQQGLAVTFFKPTTRAGDTLSGEKFRRGESGAPILNSTPAFVECLLRDSIERGDHAIMVGEVVDAGVANQPDGRPDDATLWLKDLGDKTFYGG